MIAYVDDYTGPASAFRITSPVRAKSVAPLCPLDVGDRVTVLRSRDGKPAVMRVVVDGGTYTVDAAHSPLCIARRFTDCKVVAQPQTASNPIVTAWRNIFGSIAPLLRMAHDEDAGHALAARARPAGNVAAPPLVRLLGGPETSRIDGKGFAIGWTGGKAPFTVRIVRRDGTLFASEPAQRRAIALKNLMLEPGTYTVTILDAAGNADDGGVIVGPVPKRTCPAGIAADLCPVVEAAQLVQKGPAWYLAAYERLAFASRLGTQGRALMRWLAKG
jgi:hypothetical protein